MNLVALIGRLTYEPELRSTTTGAAVLKLQIAVDRNYTTAGGQRQADFIDCIAWRNTAEYISRNFHKGNMIAIEGAIKTETFTDDEGIRRKAVTVEVGKASFCGSAPKTDPSTAYYEEVPEHDG